MPRRFCATLALGLALTASSCAGTDAGSAGATGDTAGSVASGGAGARGGAGGAPGLTGATSGAGGRAGSPAANGGSAGAAAGTASTGGDAAGGRAGAGAPGGRAGAGAPGGAAGHAGTPSGSGGLAPTGDAGAAGATDGTACESPLETLDVSRLTATETREPYAVSGSTAAELRSSIDAHRGTDYDAFTSWNIAWRFANCNGGGLTVTLDVSYSYPEWAPPAGADPALVATWQAYIDALFCHEYGHARLAVEAANDTYDALAAIDAGGDCTAQQTEASADFQGILDDYRQREVDYDATTRHGATMGAVFPP